LSAQWAQAQLYCDGTQWIALLLGTAAAQPYSEGTWTPIDSSGAGLTFTAAAGTYEKIGRQVTARCTLTYPVTADVTNAKIGGLPFTVANANEATQGIVTYSDESTLRYTDPIANTTTAVFYVAAGTQITNVTLSGNSLFLTFIYHT
jgi:subtilisin family serine protease